MEMLVIRTRLCHTGRISRKDGYREVSVLRSSAYLPVGGLESTLQFQHLCVYSLPLHERCVIASLDDGPPIQNQYLVGFLDRLEPVGDDDDRPAPEEVMKSDVDFFFGEAVERAGRFVKQDDFRIFYENFGDGKALPLSSR